mmetsp:Transcript_57056/g.105485  ORF Transcript_57056/g.105485 Transcript_57056/m.105485 type:complete len:392 (-) Transcript_57056:31-1206(-)
MASPAWNPSSSSSAGDQDALCGASVDSPGDEDDWVTDDEWGMPAYSGPHPACRPLQIQVTPIAWQPSSHSGPPRHLEPQPVQAGSNSCNPYPAHRGNAYNPFELHACAGASHTGVSQGYCCEDPRPPPMEFWSPQLVEFRPAYHLPVSPMERMRPMYYQDINPMDRAPTLDIHPYDRSPLRSLRPPSEQAASTEAESQRLHHLASRRSLSTFLRFGHAAAGDSPLTGNERPWERTHFLGTRASFSDSDSQPDISDLDDALFHDHALYGGDSEDDIETDSDCEGTILPPDELMPKTLCGPDSTAYCSICLEACTEGQLVRTLLSCGHQFHGECIEKWLARREWCPNCRQNVDQSRKAASRRVHPWPLPPLRIRGLDPPSLPRPLPFHHTSMA